MLKHYLKRVRAETDGDDARLDRHQADMDRLHPQLDKTLTAIARVEGRLGLTHEQGRRLACSQR